MRDYIFFTHLKILSGQATSFVSFFGGRKVFRICFWRKGKQTVKSFAILSLGSIPMVAREAVTTEDGVGTVQVF